MNASTSLLVNLPQQEDRVLIRKEEVISALEPIVIDSLTGFVAGENEAWEMLVLTRRVLDKLLFGALLSECNCFVIACYWWIRRSGRNLVNRFRASW